MTMFMKKNKLYKSEYLKTIMTKMVKMVKNNNLKETLSTSSLG